MAYILAMNRAKAAASPRKPRSAAAPANPRGVFEPLAPYLAEPSGALDVERITSDFSLTGAQLAEMAGLKRVTLQKTARREAPKTQTRLREMLEILARVDEWAGGKLQALAWYRAEPIPALGGRTAESMVKSGHAAMVRDYLDYIAMGGFA
jgi:hypothetical protein